MSQSDKGYYSGIYMTPEQIIQRDLRDVQCRADLLGWKIEEHRKGWFIRRGPIPGYPEASHGSVVATLGDVSEAVEDTITYYEQCGRQLITSGKLRAEERPWWKFW